MNCSTPGLPVHHHLLEFTQTHVHWVGDAIQPSHPLSSPSLPTFDLSQYQSFQMSQFFTSGPSNEFSGLNSFRIDWLELLAVQGILKSLLQHYNSSINSSALSHLYSPTLTSIHAYWKTIAWLYGPLSAKWCLCFLIYMPMDPDKLCPFPSPKSLCITQRNVSFSRGEGRLPDPVTFLKPLAIGHFHHWQPWRVSKRK